MSDFYEQGKVHFGSPDEMQELLENEGIKIDDDYVTDFDRLYVKSFKKLIINKRSYD